MVYTRMDSLDCWKSITFAPALILNLLL